ncbi:DUF5590 domain-containing protein [Fructilactobacillus sp. Tb1]|uniref:cell wall elongation regulator TseB-like domain-containing protein n=1 Tax=Fructilactobacillus sp. Tb1 TaxID=3422304 RepID=UPI003D2E3A61
MMREKRLLRLRLMRITKILLSLAIVLVFAGLISLHIAQRPLQKKQTVTIDLVEKYAKFHDVSDFSKSNVDNIYYSVAGMNKDNKPSFAVVTKNMNHIKIFKQSDGINKSKAKSIAMTNNNQKITNTGLILVKDKPAWLISLKNSDGSYRYVTINFKNGKKLSSINV